MDKSFFIFWVDSEVSGSLGLAHKWLSPVLMEELSGKITAVPVLCCRKYRCISIIPAFINADLPCCGEGFMLAGY